MSRIPRLLSTLIAVAAVACSGGASRDFLSIGTGGTGGIYYPLGGALASELSVADPTRRYTAEVTGGSVENVNRVASGEIDLGFSIGTTVRAAHQGTDGYDRPVAELRIAAPLYPNVAHVLVRGGFRAASIADLRGARVSVGSAGSGTEQFARHLLEAYGIDYDDIDERYLSFSESSSALRDQAIDAAILSVGYPASAALEAAINASIRFLPVAGEGLEELIARHPYYTAATLPAGAYPGLDEDLPTVAVMNWIVARESLDAEVVTALLDILVERRAALVQVNDIARQIDIEALRTAPIPLHPAADAWLSERGSGGSGREDRNGR